MSQPKTTPDPKVNLITTPDYREGYANSVQVRMSVWDFLLVFGTMSQEKADELNIKNFQGIYLSPQQAKALHSILSNNLEQYEQTFGTIELNQHLPQPTGPVH
ncbi:MAG TPA: DUF3467 domain-containing protein [Edaphobacter sp.]